MSEPVGTAVLVDGKVVAWFAEFTEEAHEWCTENYFGRWLTWRATPPTIVPLTEEEAKLVAQEAEALYNKLHQPMEAK